MVTLCGGASQYRPIKENPRVWFFQKILFLNILFIPGPEAQNIGVQSWTHWVMPQTTSLLRYETMLILSPDLFRIGFPLVFKTHIFHIHAKKLFYWKAGNKIC